MYELVSLSLALIVFSFRMGSVGKFPAGPILVILTQQWVDPQENQQEW